MEEEKVNDGATHPCHTVGASPMQVIYHVLKLQLGVVLCIFIGHGCA